MLKKLIVLFAVAALLVSCSDFSTNPNVDDSGKNDAGNENPGESGYIPSSDPPDIERYLFVVNNLGETISRINVDDGTVVNNIYTTGQIPAEIHYEEDILYVVCSGDNTIQMINIRDGSSQSIEIGDYHNPSHMELIGSGTAAACNWESGTVTFVDLLNRSVIADISVGAGLWGMTYHDGRLYVGITNYNPATYTYGQGRVAVIDAASRTLLDSVDVGTNPGILFVDNQNELNTVATGDYFSVFGSVWRINISDNSVIGSYDIGGSPTHEVKAPNGEVYLGAGGWDTEGYVLKYDSGNENVIYSGNNPIVLSGEAGAQGAAVDNSGNIYVCCFNTDHVVKMSPSGTVLATYNVGDGPQTMVFVQYDNTLVWRP